MFELQLFGKAVCCGAALAFLYEFFRILRKLIAHGTFWVSLEDLVYWLLCGFLIFRMLYRENSGAVRGFVMAAVVLGMLLYVQFAKIFRIIRKKLHKCIKEVIMSLKST